MDDQSILDELRDNITKKDSIKARLVLKSLDFTDRKLVTRIVFELSRADDDFSFPLFTSILELPSLDLGVEQKIRDTITKKIVEKPARILSILQNDKIRNRHEFIELATMLNVQQAVPVLSRILHDELNLDLLKSALPALAELAGDDEIEIIGEYLYSEYPDLIKTAVQSLESIASAEAIHKLADRLGKNTEIDIYIIKALARLQSLPAMQVLVGLLASGQALLRNRSRDELFRIGAKAVPEIITLLNHEDPDVLVQVLNVLGQIGDITAAQPIRKLLFEERGTANVRFAAYEALGFLPLKKGAFILTSGLNDPAEQVRLAAARAIERNLDESMMLGIENLAREDQATGERVVSAFIDAEADQVVLHLVRSEQARSLVLAYLNKRAHPDTHQYFKELFSSEHISGIIEPTSTETTAKTKMPVVYVVDDSRMILQLYKKIFHQEEFEHTLFSDPTQVEDAVSVKKPDILITDLNMPDINGIQLTQLLRTRHDQKALPIIMVTTQDDRTDYDAAFAAGVNAFLNKPFSHEQLIETIRRYI